MTEAEIYDAAYAKTDAWISALADRPPAEAAGAWAFDGAEFERSRLTETLLKQDAQHKETRVQEAKHAMSVIADFDPGLLEARQRAVAVAQNAAAGERMGGGPVRRLVLPGPDGGLVVKETAGPWAEFPVQRLSDAQDVAFQQSSERRRREAEDALLVSHFGRRAVVAAGFMDQATADRWPDPFAHAPGGGPSRIP